MRIILRAGARVNETNSFGLNALKHYLTVHTSVSKRLSLLLHAAGETVGGSTISTSRYGFVNIIRVQVPEVLKFTDLRLDLKHLCRMAIRKRLIGVDAHAHLFARVPALGLPVSLAGYLLFDMSLEDQEEEYDPYDQVELRRRRFLPWNN